MPAYEVTLYNLVGQPETFTARDIQREYDWLGVIREDEEFTPGVMRRMTWYPATRVFEVKPVA